MRLTFDSRLADAVGRVRGAAAGKTTKPILAGVKIDATAAGVTLQCYDLECGIRTRAEGVTVEREGACVVPVDRLAKALAEMDGGTLDADDKQVRLRGPGVNYTLPTWPAEDFPELPTAEEPGVTLPTASLHSALARVAFAADRRESTRFALSGVLCELAGGKLTLVATDSRRLAVCPAGDASGNASALLPLKAIGLLGKLGGESTRLVLRANEAMAESEGTTVYTRLVEGKYPDWKAILPKSTPLSVPLVADAFARSVRQAAIMTDAETRRVDLTFAEGVCTLRAQGATSGSGEVVHPLPGFTGTLSIAFDPAFLLDWLRAVEGEVVMRATAGDKPAVFESGDARLLVMPLAG